MYLVEYMVEMYMDSKLFYLVVFDDSTVSIFDAAKFSVVNEFSMKYIFKYKEFIENNVEKSNK